LKAGENDLTEGKEVEGERIRKMAELRALLEKRVNEMETELDGLRVLLDFVNAALVEKGFKRAEITPALVPIAEEEETLPLTEPSARVEVFAVPPVPEYAQAVPIKTVTGELLANLYMNEDSMRVVLDETKRFTVDVPPFMAFLVERVLAKMQEKDREAAAAGEIPPDKILSYSIVRDGDLLREITIMNVGGDRARELKSTIRWTLEKMHEKMRSNV
jgi:hypothetical protein